MENYFKSMGYSLHKTCEAVTYTDIASKIGWTIAELEQLNGKSWYDTIYAGQVLKVP